MPVRSIELTQLQLEENRAGDKDRRQQNQRRGAEAEHCDTDQNRDGHTENKASSWGKYKTFH